MDKINPNYYTRYKILPTEFILKNKLGFCEGNVIKYICRYKEKNGIEDLRKAIKYIEILIEEEEKKWIYGWFL